MYCKRKTIFLTYYYLINKLKKQFQWDKTFILYFRFKKSLNKLMITILNRSLYFSTHQIKINQK